MSVTVADLLQLPSLRNAEVIGGRGGLERMVSSISVLETIDVSILNESHFPDDPYLGSEMVITGFVNAAENVDVQVESIKRLAEGGEAGMILYYVGVILKEVDQRLIDMADELDFTLICMPKNEINLRYSEVICEVMDAVIKDQMENTSFTVALLEQIARLPKHRQTVDTMIKMLSNRLRASVILTDDRFRVLNEATWPQELSGLHTILSEMTLPEPGKDSLKCSKGVNGWIARERISTLDLKILELFMIRDGENLSAIERYQALECVRLSINLWSQHHGQAVISELVQAILMDEPMKMRSLANLFHVDIVAVNTMWIFSGTVFTEERIHAVTECAKSFCTIAFADVFDGMLTLFTNGLNSIADIEALLVSVDDAIGEPTHKTLFTNLETTTHAREKFLMNKAHIEDVEWILPNRSYYDGSEIEFSKNCRNIIQQGEEQVTAILSVFNALEKKRDAEELKETLGVYLLDADQSVQKTSEMLYVHKNTIKYRLKSMADCFGFTVGKMPASYQLYEALAILRLLK